MRNLIVLAIDRLNASFLGPYGNTWLETPAFNRLASQSILLEWLYCEAPELADACQALWRACWMPQGHAFHRCFLTDEPGLGSIAESHFDVIRTVPQPAEVVESAGDPSETQLAHVMAEGLAAVAELTTPYFLWVHCRGMSGPWDAPLDWRNALADEEDPIPPALVAPPQRQYAQPPDPDELLGLHQAYAGQVMLLDQLLDAWLDEVAAQPSTGLVVLAPRGYPLGEHGIVGGSQCLHEELLHVPCLIRLPEGRGGMSRVQSLLQLSDLGGLLNTQFSDDAAERLPVDWDLCDPRAQVLIQGADGAQAIRTPKWFLNRSGDGQVQLYAKPDDRCEWNEVSRLCPEVVESLLSQSNR